MANNKTSHHHEADPKFVHLIGEGEAKTIVFKPLGLNIIWGNDPSSWLLPFEDGKPAELKSACWLEVTGSTDIDFGKTYRISFRVSFKPESTGWDTAPVFISAKIGKKGKTIWKRVRSVNDNSNRGEAELLIPNQTDGPLEISPSGPSPTAGSQKERLHFGLYEVWAGHWKSGLMIHEALVEEVGVPKPPH